jgi:predicted Zn-dependent protease with MMP-like domain
VTYKAGSRRNFERLVTQALDRLPEDLASHISNVEIVIEEEVDPGAEQLLGLYEGIPLTKRGHEYFGVLPDRITLFRPNIENAAGSRRHLQEIVRRTVIHEVAHHFGIDDDRLEELGWA